jgi:two-component system, NtrC family, response regulator HydG
VNTNMNPVVIPTARPLLGIVGSNAAMRKVLELVERVAESDATALIVGESGTGKELIARALHERSPRRGGPFVAVDCGALGESTIDSDLFGHVQGAFTGASCARAGLFEVARGGTLFLDGIAELSAVSQLKLLRVLQEREVRPLGSSEPRSVDVRVIAATHRNLAGEVAAGRFREDLYYRVDVATVLLPPLRERLDDIPLLARHFLRKQGTALDFDAEALRWLSANSWPGNVRELQNVIVRAALTATKATLSVSDLQPAYVDRAARLPTPPPMKLARGAFEVAYIDAVLERARGNVSMAARIAGMDRTNFRRLLRRHGRAHLERV